MDTETEQLKKQLEYRKRFMERINEIHSASNLNQILLQLKDSIAPLFDAERITIYMADNQKKLLISRAKSGNEVQQISVPISPTSIAGFCAHSGALFSIRDAYDDHELAMINSGLRFDRSWDQKTGFRTRQVLCVPMKSNNVLIGVIQLINKGEAETFTETDLNYATELATSLSIAIHNINRLTASSKLIRQESRYNHLLDKNLIEEKDIRK